MALTGQPGEVTFVIYYGTKFDDINVPFNASVLKTSATKSITVTGQYVWQTTWLSALRVDLPNDYQDIVGAQYIEMDDTGSSSHGTHWFSVTGYTQISPKTALVGLRYDALLSIGLDNIAGITGILKRWTVTDDSHFKYVDSDEPLDAIAKPTYSYYRYRAVNIANLSYTYLAGFPYDMSTKPSVVTYVNSNGTDTGVRRPVMPPASSSTKFTSTAGQVSEIDDGLRYYDWLTLEGYSVYENLSAAIGLGVDVPCKAYMLPKSPLITLTYNTPNDLSYASINGATAPVNTGFGLYETGYNNSKSGDLGITYTLYNELSGDVVSARNTEMGTAYFSGNIGIWVGCNPHPDGYFYAYFDGFNNGTSTGNDLTSGSGINAMVRSTGYQPLTIRSGQALGQSLNNFNNQIEKDTARVNYNNQDAATSLALRVQERYTRTQLFNTGVNSAATLANGNPLSLSAAITGVNQALTNAGNAQDVFTTGLQATDNARAQQFAALTALGNINNSLPAHVKLANTELQLDSSYTFVVQKASLSQSDRQRADRFFTAFGYNVNNELLTSPSQLQNRTRFTFVMADDVQITSLASGAENTRVRDLATVQQIQERFSTGLRIWHVEPDFDYSVPNPVRSN